MASKLIKNKKFSGVYSYDSERNTHKGKPDRTFYINYRRPADGKLVWEKIGKTSEGYSAQLASNIRNERLRDQRHGDIPEVQAKRKKLTVGKLWEEYKRWAEQNRAHVKTEISRYQKHLEPSFSERPLSAISVKELEDYRDRLLSDGYTPATVKHCLVLLRQMFNKAKQWGMWRGENPVSKIRLPSPDNKRERFLTQEEASKLLAELGRRSAKLRLIAFVSLRTGMRAGEIFDMRWQDVNFDYGIINVRGKGAISRQAYMTEDLARALYEWPRGKSGYVLEDRKHGGRIREVSRAFDEAVKKVGLNDNVDDKSSKQRVVFHTLRHTFASWLALAGYDIFTIKELMGHSNIEMTMRYAHLIPDQKRRAVESVGYEL